MTCRRSSPGMANKVSVLSDGLIAENAVQRDIAVIDIGSNSVRLVHFRLEGPALWPVYNEKVMAGLGQGVRQTGRLNTDGVDLALRALKRFQRLLDAKAVHDRHVVATAAVRNAEDGSDFILRVKALSGLVVHVLSGEAEGEMSAQGLLAGLPGAHGMTGDLGGSSLELTQLNAGEAGQGRTFALGPQEVIGAEWDYAKAKKKIDKRLADADFAQCSGETFYAVGGAWRALAQIAFARGDYPLRVVHGFAMEQRQIRPLTRLVAGMSEASLLATPGVSRRRAASLPYAALLMRRILKHGKFSRVVFSAYGLREGVIMASLPRELIVQDPLIAGAEALARPVSPTPGFGRALANWIAPLMSEMEPVFPGARDRILQESAARLADLGGRMHPDHRVDLARDSVLYAPFAGISHPERAFLAATIHVRYGGSRSRFETLDVARLLRIEQLDRAKLIGMALRLGAKLSGRSEHLLSRFKLSAPPGALRLDIDESVHDLYVERSVSLLDEMAAVIGRKAEVAYG